jgi:hypothetical protein
MKKTMMMAEAMTMAKRMGDMPMKLKGCCGK